MATSKASGSAKGDKDIGPAALDKLTQMIASLAADNADLRSSLKEEIKSSKEELKQSIGKNIEDMDKKFTQLIDDNQQKTDEKFEELQKQLDALKASCQETDARVNAMQADAAKPSSDDEGADAHMVGGEYEGDSATTMGKRKLQKTGYGPSVTHVNRGQGAASPSGGPPTYNIGTPRGTSSGRSHPAGSSPPHTAPHPQPSNGKDIWTTSRNRITISGFPKDGVIRSQQEKVATNFLSYIPTHLCTDHKVWYNNGGAKFSIEFKDADTAKDVMAKFKESPGLEWVNPADKQTVALKVGPDRSLGNKLLNIVLGNLWQQLEQLPQFQAKRPVESKLQTNGPGGKLFLVHEEAMTSLYLVVPNRKQSEFLSFDIKPSYENLALYDVDKEAADKIKEVAKRSLDRD